MIRLQMETTDSLVGIRPSSLRLPEILFTLHSGLLTVMEAVAITAEVAEAPLAVAAEVLLVREITVLHRLAAREPQP